MLTSESCPFNFFEYGKGSINARTISSVVLLSLCEGAINLALLFIAGYVMRCQLPMIIDLEESFSGPPLFIIFLMSVATSGLALTFKAVDTSYDMLTALIWPLFKLIVVVWMTQRDIASSIQDLRREIVLYDLDFPRNSMLELVHIFKFFSVLKRVRLLVTLYNVVSILTLVLFSIFAQRVYWLMALLAYQLIQLILFSLLAIALYPSFWVDVKEKDEEECRNRLRIIRE